MKISWLITALFIFSVQVDAEIHPLSLQADQQFETGQTETALEDYNRLIQEFPEKKEGYFNRGLCLYKLQKYSEAIFDFKECLSIDSNFNRARIMQAICLEKSGAFIEANGSYQRLKTKSTNHALLERRIKNYRLAVLISSKWYYMLAIMLVVLLLMAVVAKSVSYRKW